MDIQISDLEFQNNDLNFQIYDFLNNLKNLEVQIHDFWNNLKNMEVQILDFYTNPRLDPNYFFEMVYLLLRTVFEITRITTGPQIASVKGSPGHAPPACANGTDMASLKITVLESL